MTVVTGTVIKCEGIHDVINEMNIDDRMLVDELSDSAKDEFIAEHNSICSDWDGEPVDTVDEIPSEIIAEWQEWVSPKAYSLDELVYSILEQRETNYAIHKEQTLRTPFYAITVLDSTMKVVDEDTYDEYTSRVDELLDVLYRNGYDEQVCAIDELYKQLEGEQ